MKTMIDILQRIETAFDEADRVLSRFHGLRADVRFKGQDNPVTDVDEALDRSLREALSPLPSEGWLSEETADDPSRLDKTATWIVDPLDGTKEFVREIPEWCISIGFVVDGVPVAGGIYAPSSGTRIIGAVGQGVSINGNAAKCRDTTKLSGALVLASRSEVERGEWDAFFGEEISVRTMGSVALKAGLVGSGHADATFSLTPKNEWDIAAGCAIVHAGGGKCSRPDGSPLTFNDPDPLKPGFVAAAAGVHDDLAALIEHASKSPKETDQPNAGLNRTPDTP